MPLQVASSDSYAVEKELKGHCCRSSQEHGMNGMAWNGMEWHGMVWNGME